MNNLGQQDVQTLIESFQRQVCGSSNIFVHEYEFHKRVQGSNESFDEFYNDLQTLLNKCQYKDCCQSSTRMSCKNRILLARLVAGIKSHDIRKGLLCIQDLTLDKAVQYIQVDEATSSQADKFLTKVNKTGASTYRQKKFPYNTGKGGQFPPTKDENLRKCKFCMKYHVFKKEFCPAKDSVCRDCQNKGHWAKSVMCPKSSKPTGDSVDPDKKVTDESSKLGSATKPTLKVISADQELPVTSDVSVKAITISSVGKHYYTDFILGNHNWKQKCMIDPGSNINCVGYDWITRFDTPEWSYNLECGSIKTAGGHNLDVEARVLLKISWPPENPTISADQWFYIVHGEDGIILGSPACHALGVIDDDWPISTLLQNLNHPSSVNTLDASENNPPICDNKPTDVDHPVSNLTTSECRTLLLVNSQEPLQQPPLPIRPWDKLGVDLYSLNDREYLIVTDYFSSFTEIYDLGKDATAPALIKELTQLFSRFGQPVEVVSDGGSQFTCKAFATFVESWNFIHTVSSPTHAQSNGKAEAAVKNIKKLLKKCGSMNDQFWKGLLAIRNTPLLCGKSPAELLLGRTLHDSLPRYPGPTTIDNETKAKILDIKKKEKDTYDQHTTPLPPLHTGTRVAIRSRVDSDWSLLGTIAEIKPNRTYISINRPRIDTHP